MEETTLKREKKWLVWFGGIAVAVVAGALLLVVLFTPPSYPAAQPAAQPSYPEPTTFEDSETYAVVAAERRSLSEEFLASVQAFGARTVPLALEGEEVNELYSPLSLYMAAALCAETAGGETRRELLAALGVDGVATLREEVPKLFRINYFDNEIGKLNLANSLWLDEALPCREDTLFRLAEDYYASSFPVDFGDPDTPGRIAAWVSGGTGKRLGGDPSAFDVPENTALLLLNTLYFRDQWIDELDAGETKPSEFTRADGSTVTCDFMNRTFGSKAFVGVDGYQWASLSFKNRCSMRFVLPDEGITPRELLADPDTCAAILSGEGPESQFGEVVFQIPKFHYDASLDLTDALRALGVEEAFSAEAADFSGLTEGRAWLSGIRQETTISIDEKGCEAAAFTEITYAGAALPDGRCEMRLTRPFLFVIESAGTPLFVGIVDDPAAK